jgi:hypothetical protein
MARSEVTGFSVAVEVFVPSETAEQAVWRLDEEWQVDSWTPAAAAFEVVNEALGAAGLHGAVDRGVRAVTT